MQEIWLPPKTKNSKSVGRFIDADHEYTDRNGVKQRKEIVVFLSKPPGSNDVSTNRVKDDANGKKIKDEWPLAWAHYLKQKEAEAARTEPIKSTAEEVGLEGTPIEDLTFLGKDQMARLKMMGFLLAEQVAEMSDTDCNNVGFGAKTWRKKAAEHLVVVKDAKK